MVGNVVGKYGVLFPTTLEANIGRNFPTTLDANGGINFLVSGVAAKPEFLTHDSLWIKLMAELYDCSERHGGCDACSRRPACVTDYDYVVDDLIQRREDAVRFLEELKDAEGAAAVAN